MSISFNGDITNVVNTLNQQNSTANKANTLQSNLKSLDGNSTDEELMQACKSFEAYLVEQVLTRVKDTLVPKEEDENEYLTMFGDRLYQEYAQTIADNGEIGLAQKLYEAMKRDYGIALKDK